MRVEASVLMDDDDGTQLASRILRLHQITLHVAAAAGIGDILAGQAIVIFGDDFGGGLVGGQ